MKKAIFIFSLLFLLPFATLAATQEMDLGNLAQFRGVNPNDWAGYSVASAGDVNADGYDDVLIGAPGTDNGSVYLFYGGSSALTSVSLANADVVFTGEYAGDQAGYSVASAGDFNGDGYDDILIGAPQYREAITKVGIVYVVLGSNSLSGTINLAYANLKYIGENSNDQVGRALATAGDFNGDGVDDVIIGASDYLGDADSGAAYVILGSTAHVGHTLYLNNAEFKYVGGSTGDQAGYSVSTAGDLNNDGYADILIGAPGYDDLDARSELDAGAVYVIYGSASSGITLSLNNAINKLIGEREDDRAGSSVASGNFDGTRVRDILVGAPGYENGQSKGAAYLVRNEAVSGDAYLSTTADAKFIGNTAGDDFGLHVASAKDVNSDGQADFLISSDGFAGGNKGVVYLYYGEAYSGNYKVTDADVKYVGENVGDFAGVGLAGAGDVDNDGYADVLIGAPYHDGQRAAGNNDGVAYLNYFVNGTAQKEVINVLGLKKGKVKVVYDDGTLAAFNAFGQQRNVDKKTLVKRFKNTKKWVVLSALGNKMALFNGKKILNRKVVTKVKRPITYLKIFKLKGKYFAIAASKKKNIKRRYFTLVNIKANKNKLGQKYQFNKNKKTNLSKLKKSKLRDLGGTKLTNWLKNL